MSQHSMAEGQGEEKLLFMVARKEGERVAERVRGKIDPPGHPPVTYFLPRGPTFQSSIQLSMD